jgi:hypothetical protein
MSAARNCDWLPWVGSPRSASGGVELLSVFLLTFDRVIAWQQICRYRPSSKRTRAGQSTCRLWSRSLAAAFRSTGDARSTPVAISNEFRCRDGLGEGWGPIRCRAAAAHCENLATWWLHGRHKAKSPAEYAGPRFHAGTCKRPVMLAERFYKVPAIPTWKTFYITITGSQGQQDIAQRVRSRHRTHAQRRPQLQVLTQPLGKRVTVPCD